MTTPATDIAIFFHTGCCRNPPCTGAAEASAGFSPAIFTYPPRKNRSAMMYSVPPFLKDHSVGPQPMANFSTVMPSLFAVRKWPSSWTNIVRPIVIIMYNTSTIYHRLRIRARGQVRFQYLMQARVFCVFVAGHGAGHIFGYLIKTYLPVQEITDGRLI